MTPRKSLPHTLSFFALLLELLTCPAFSQSTSSWSGSAQCQLTLQGAELSGCVYRMSSGFQFRHRRNGARTFAEGSTKALVGATHTASVIVGLAS